VTILPIARHARRAFRWVSVVVTLAGSRRCSARIST